jgi:hypothetical protein
MLSNGSQVKRDERHDVRENAEKAGDASSGTFDEGDTLIFHVKPSGDAVNVLKIVGKDIG